MSFARSDVRKDNSFRNAKAPLLQKIFHLLSTTAIFCLLSTAIFCLLSVADVVRRLAPGGLGWRLCGPVWCLRACLAPVRLFAACVPVCRLRARLPPGACGLVCRPRARHSLARGPSGAIFAGSHPVLGPASPSLLGVGPLWGHPCGLAPRFWAREPVAPWRGAPLGPSLRARTPFWGP